MDQKNKICSKSIVLIGLVCFATGSCANVNQLKDKWKNLVAKVSQKSALEIAEKEASKNDAAVRIEYFAVRKGQLIKTRELFGKLAFTEQLGIRSDRRLLLGKARSVVGASVKRGDLLFDVDKKEAVAKKVDLNDRLRLAEIDIKAAENQKVFSKKQYDRKLELASKGIAAKKDIDEAERAYRAADSAFQAKDLDRQKAARELRELIDQLSGADIIAPLDGVILRIAKGGVDVSAGQELATIATPGKLSFFSKVDEALIVYFKKGDKIQIRSASNAFKDVEGIVGSVALTPSDQYGPKGYDVRVDLLQADVSERNLRNGYDAVAILPQSSTNDAIIAPLAALQTGGSGYFILVAKSNGSSATPRAVKIGLRSSLEVEVLSGLTSGEYAVVPTGGVR